MLLLITLITDSEILLRTHSNGYIKGDKYFFFLKVGGTANVLLKLSYLLQPLKGAVWSRTYEKQDAEKISQFLKFATILYFI